MTFHAATRAHIHNTWDNRRARNFLIGCDVIPISSFSASIPPTIRIQSGDTVTFECRDASDGQLTPSSGVDAMEWLVFEKMNPLSGPVHIQGAEPGDVLQIDVIKLETADWGWTAVIPGFGLLADEFRTPALKFWKVDKEKQFAWFDDKKQIRIPVRPFCGEMGVARGKKGCFSAIPPYTTGGNIDTRHITEGSTLFLPVEVEGALFSCGDGHLAQGDGEVCGTAIETQITATFKFIVRKDKPSVKTPHFLSTSRAVSEEYYTTTGVEDDVLKATRSAVREMINHLATEHGLSRLDAYLVRSVAGELRMHQVVDMPNYLVGMMMPTSIFHKEG